MALRIKRVYEDAAKADGYRVLVDRLWPRGLSKDTLVMDVWAKDLAPSNDLRKATHSGEMSFARFATAYKKELGRLESEQLDDVLKRLGAGKTVTLLYAAKDETQNHALVLAEWLKSQA